MSLILSGTDGISDVDGSASTPALRGTDANTGIFFPAADTIAFSEGGVESMRIDSSGNVGIGTTSPSIGLTVVKDNGSGYVASFRANTGSPALTIQTTGGITQIQGINSAFTDVANIAFQPSGGNVGIGTAIPSTRLAINDPGTGLGFTNAASGNFNLGLLGGTGSAEAFIYNRANAALIFGTNNTERMRIDSSGRVGIGISTINQQLAVAGTANATYSSASGMVVNLLGSSTGVVVPIGFSWSGSIGNTSPYWGMGFIPTNFGSGVGDLGFYTNATEKMRILSSGNILCLSGGSTTANGTGIAFPATQSASSDANTLDDYEEGTFTPTAPATGYTLSSAVGIYTKIGRVVTITFRVVFSAVPANNSAVTCAGVPFTALSYGSSECYTGVVRENNNTGAIYVANIQVSDPTRFEINSMDGVAAGSQRTIRTNEGYCGTITYFTS